MEEMERKHKSPNANVVMELLYCIILKKYFTVEYSTLSTHKPRGRLVYSRTSYCKYAKEKSAKLWLFRK